MVAGWRLTAKNAGLRVPAARLLSPRERPCSPSLGDPAASPVCTHLLIWADLDPAVCSVYAGQQEQRAGRVCRVCSETDLG